MTLQATDWFYRVVDDVIVDPTKYPRPRVSADGKVGYGDNDPDSLLAAHEDYRLWEEVPTPGPYQRFKVGTPSVNAEASPPRVERVDTLENWTADEIRSYHERSIRSQRESADQSALDVREDPGLNGLMDEANVAAEIKLKDLDNTADGDLAAFDATLDPRSGNSVQVSASMAGQTRALLASPVPLTAQQQTDLDVAATAWEGIVDAGDTQAAVPEVPSFARLHIGVFGEEFGRAVARRIQDGGWWWIEIELLIERNLDDATYFVAIYDISAPDDRDDTDTDYRTTAQLTDMGDGRFLADKNAINLPQTDTSLGIKFTLCKGHITLPQFDRVSFKPDDLKERYRFRWGQP